MSKNLQDKALFLISYVDKDFSKENADEMVFVSIFDWLRHQYRKSVRNLALSAGIELLSSLL